MGSEESSMTMDRGILENLKMIRRMVKGHTIRMMVISIPVNVLMVSKKAKEKRNTLMVLHMKVNS